MAVTIFGQQGFQTTQNTDTNGFIFLSQSLQGVTGPSSASSVLCGFQAYRSATVQAGSADSIQDAGVIQRRIVYRSVGGA
jgi:hypothetical protein